MAVAHVGSVVPSVKRSDVDIDHCNAYAVFKNSIDGIRSKYR